MIYFLQNLGFVLNLKKPGTISENRIFGHGYRLSKDGNLVALTVARKINVTVRASSTEQRDYHHGCIKVNRENKINCQAILAAQPQNRYLQRL